MEEASCVIIASYQLTHSTGYSLREGLACGRDWSPEVASLLAMERERRAESPIFVERNKVEWNKKPPEWKISYVSKMVFVPALIFIFPLL